MDIIFKNSNAVLNGEQKKKEVWKNTLPKDYANFLNYVFSHTRTGQEISLDEWAANYFDIDTLSDYDEFQELSEDLTDIFWSRGYYIIEKNQHCKDKPILLEIPLKYFGSSVYLIENQFAVKALERYADRYAVTENNNVYDSVTNTFLEPHIDQQGLYYVMYEGEEREHKFYIKPALGKEDYIGRTVKVEDMRKVLI